MLFTYLIVILENTRIFVIFDDSTALIQKQTFEMYLF